MRILVTGSSGTIGTRLCEELMKRGHDVTGVDWVTNKWNDGVQAVTRNIDMRDKDALDKLATTVQFEAIVHLAANARVYELVENPDRALDNMVTTFNALEFARSRGITRFLFASSRESYGNAGQRTYKEDAVRVENCESPYTASKIAGEALVEAYSRCYGIDHITFRFSNVYGMYDDSIRVVPLFIRQARKGEPLSVFGGEKCLDFTYIDDCVAGIIQALEKFDDVKNETYNLAFGEGTTILHLAERIKEILRSDSVINVGEPRTGEVVKYIADISKAREKLGYNPQIGLDAGIEKAVEWYTKHA
jgi:nucleoside-diphosphate-sugar epimerase